MKQLYVLVWLVLMGASHTLFAQEKITKAEQRSVIDSLNANMERNYVFPEVAKKMAAALNKKFKSGSYDGLTNPANFAGQLTADLQNVSNDKHLRISFDPRRAAMMRQHQEEEGPHEPDPQYMKRVARSNYGFNEVKILEGNVGYIDLRGFMSAGVAGETAAAAMNMVSNADAIIFDLRQNGGGDPGMIQLLTSYLYSEGDLIHLNNFYFRPTDEHTQTWTLPYVPGKRNPDAEVFVLTSDYTFSAAEEFAYNLKNLERATIVGETTGGGAHPGGAELIGERFVAFMPNGRAINPITNTNWEGTGVSPHIEIDSEEALEKAHQLALEKLAEKMEEEEDKQYYAWFASFLKAKNEPAEISKTKLMAYAGKYGPRNLLYEDGKLYYQRDGRPRMDLLYMSETSFAFADDPSIRIDVEYEKGEAKALIISSSNGWKERNERSLTKP